MENWIGVITDLILESFSSEDSTTAKKTLSAILTWDDDIFISQIDSTKGLLEIYMNDFSQDQELMQLIKQVYERIDSYVEDN